MSYLDNVTNFSHCPLKKRPLNFISHQNNELDQPEDLSVKRQKTNDWYEVSQTEEQSTPSVILSTNCSTQPPSLHTSVNSRSEVALPQSSFENSLNEVSQNPVPLPEPRLPSLADFYLQLFQQSTVQSQVVPQQTSWNNVWPVLPSGRPWNMAPNPPVPSSVSPSVESNLSSPRSISSEDSGFCGELVSEDEIDSNRGDILKSNPQRHTCKSCRKSYSTESGLRKHSELHCSFLGPRAFTCEHCSRSYTSIGALKMHIRTHTLPCKCHVCGKAFSRPWLLQGHIRTHTGEKPFKCIQCHRSFADRSNLRAHQQTHERVKKYGCHTCKKTFSRMSLLTKHIENACPGKYLPSNN